MSQGRSSVNSATVALAFLLCLLVYVENVRAATYVVGGSTGWTFNVANWPKGKRFRAGDTLIFNYARTMHDVTAVNRVSYRSCKAPAGAKVYKSGKDRIRLMKGQNYFICSIPGHCQSGMKIAINAV